MKSIIKLNESDIRSMINESVRRILKEGVDTVDVTVRVDLPNGDYQNVKLTCEYDRENGEVYDASVADGIDNQELADYVNDEWIPSHDNDILQACEEQAFGGYDNDDIMDSALDECISRAIRNYIK